MKEMVGRINGLLYEEDVVMNTQKSEIPLSFLSPESSSVVSASYEPDVERLTVILMPAKTYVYLHISQAKWKGFVEAESKGSYFAHEIRPFYPGKRTV
jgi:hypothetical protein